MSSTSKADDPSNLCSTSCQLNCSSIINEKKGRQILAYFTKLGSRPLQILFLQKCVELDDEEHNANTVAKHFFTLNGKRIDVCEQFFTSTLEITADFTREALGVDWRDALSKCEKENSKLRSTRAHVEVDESSVNALSKSEDHLQADGVELAAKRNLSNTFNESENRTKPALRRSRKLDNAEPETTSGKSSVSCEESDFDPILRRSKRSLGDAKSKTTSVCAQKRSVSRERKNSHLEEPAAKVTSICARKRSVSRERKNSHVEEPAAKVTRTKKRSVSRERKNSHVEEPAAKVTRAKKRSVSRERKNSHLEEPTAKVTSVRNKQRSASTERSSKRSVPGDKSKSGPVIRSSKISLGEEEPKKTPVHSKKRSVSCEGKDDTLEGPTVKLRKSTRFETSTPNSREIVETNKKVKGNLDKSSDKIKSTPTPLAKIKKAATPASEKQLPSTSKNRTDSKISSNSYSLPKKSEKTESVTSDKNRASLRNKEKMEKSSSSADLDKNQKTTNGWENSASKKKDKTGPVQIEFPSEPAADKSKLFSKNTKSVRDKITEIEDNAKLSSKNTKPVANKITEPLEDKPKLSSKNNKSVKDRTTEPIEDNAKLSSKNTKPVANKITEPLEDKPKLSSKNNKSVKDRTTEPIEDNAKLSSKNTKSVVNKITEPSEDNAKFSSRNKKSVANKTTEPIEDNDKFSSRNKKSVANKTTEPIEDNDKFSSRNKKSVANKTTEPIEDNDKFSSDEDADKSESSSIPSYQDESSGDDTPDKKSDSKTPKDEIAWKYILNDETKLAAKKHIKSIPRVVVCERNEAGEFEYAESSIKVETMYEIFKNKCKKEGQKVVVNFINYQIIFNQMDLVFEKCRDSLPYLEENEVTIMSLK